MSLGGERCDGITKKSTLVQLATSAITAINRKVMAEQKAKVEVKIDKCIAKVRDRKSKMEAKKALKKESDSSSFDVMMNGDLALLKSKK